MKNNRMMIIILLVVVIAVAAGAWWFVNREPVEKFSDFSTGDHFVTNVGGSSKRLLKTAVVLRLNTDKSKVIEEVFNINKSKIRDCIITILREQDEATLLDPATQDLLKERIKTEVNLLLESEYIKEIHFSDFVVQ